MDELSCDFFYILGAELCKNVDTSNNEKKVDFIESNKTIEDYKKMYIKNLNKYIDENNKTINELNNEIFEIEKKRCEIIRIVTNKKYNGNIMNFIYSNKPVINYLRCLNTLESEKIKYYDLTLERLYQEIELNKIILQKNILLLNKANNNFLI